MPFMTQIPLHNIRPLPSVAARCLPLLLLVMFAGESVEAARSGRARTTTQWPPTKSTIAAGNTTLGGKAMSSSQLVRGGTATTRKETTAVKTSSYKQTTAAKTSSYKQTTAAKTSTTTRSSRSSATTQSTARATTQPKTYAAASSLVMATKLPTLSLLDFGILNMSGILNIPSILNVSNIEPVADVMFTMPKLFVPILMTAVEPSTQPPLMSQLMAALAVAMKEKGSLSASYGPLLVDIVNNLRTDDSTMKWLNGDDAMIMVAVCTALKGVQGTIPPTAADLMVALTNLASIGQITPELVAVIPSLIFSMESGVAVPSVQTTSSLLATLQQQTDAGVTVSSAPAIQALLLEAIGNLRIESSVLELAVAGGGIRRNTCNSINAMLQYLSVVSGPLSASLGQVMLKMFLQLQQLPASGPYTISSDLSASLAAAVEALGSATGAATAGAVQPVAGALAGIKISSAPRVSSLYVLPLACYMLTAMGAVVIDRS